MRLDVLHVLSSDNRRGAETFGYALHEALGARGVRSDARCLQPGGSDQHLPVPALGPSRFSMAGLRALRRRAREASVVVAHGSNTLLACGAGLVGTGVPFVYVSIGDPRYWANTRLRRWRAGRLIRRAAAVVVISASARPVVVAHYHLDRRIVRVIPNGRSGSRFRPADHDRRIRARQALGLPADRDIIAIVGALSPEKRVDLAIAAVGQVPNAVLAVAGEGSERSALEAMARQLAPERVHFLGATEGPDDVLAAADAVVLSSDSEGVPGIVIEAGLCALPVVATDVGWVGDVVRAGVTGLLVPPGRPEQLAVALRTALDQRDVLGKAARQHCLAEFEMAAVTDKWQRLLREVSRS